MVIWHQTWSKDNSSNMRWKPLLLFHGLPNRTRSFRCTIQERIVHTMAFATPVVEHWLELEIDNESTKRDPSGNSLNKHTFSNYHPVLQTFSNMNITMLITCFINDLFTKLKHIAKLASENSSGLYDPLPNEVTGVMTVLITSIISTTTQQHVRE